MNPIATPPKGWTETIFGKVVSPVSVNDKKLPKGDYLESGRFPVVDQGQKFIGGYSNDETKVISDDLPLLVFGDHTRAFKYLDQPFVPGADGIKVLKPVGVNAKWLFHIAHALDFPDKGYARHYQHLKTARLIVPPLPEQRRIVADIEKQFSRLEEGVGALRRVQANLKRYRAAVLKAACEGQLVPTEAEIWKSGSGILPLGSDGKRQDAASTLGEPFESGAELLARILAERRKNWQGRGKYKEPAAPDSAKLPPLPEGWAWASLGQICFKITDGTHHSPINSPTGDYKYITSKNVREFKLLLDDVTYVDAATHKEIYSRCDVRLNDILYVKDGVNTGLAAKNTLKEQFSLLSSVGVFRAVPSVNPDYLVACLNSKATRDRMLSQVAGVAITRLTLNKLESSIVAIPPVAEQTRIVAEVERRLSVVEEMEATVEANLQRATRLRQSILQKAFEGKLVASA